MRKTFLEYLDIAEAANIYMENCSAGATSSANVAAAPTALGGLGVGFDPDGDHGVYGKPKRKRKDKVTVIRR